MTEVWMKEHIVSDSDYNIIKVYFPKTNYKECQILLGLHLVLATLHKRFTFSIE